MTFSIAATGSSNKQPQHASQQEQEDDVFPVSAGDDSTAKVVGVKVGVLHSKKPISSTSMSLREACRLLRLNDDSLTVLHVNDCRASASSTAATATATATGITTSDEAGDFVIDDDRWLELATSLSYNRRLLELDLSNTSISYGGVDALSRAIGANKKSPLQSMNLSWNHIGPDGARQIARHIVSRSCPPGLRDLNLCGTGLGDGGMASLARALATNTCPNLNVDVGHNNIGAVGASHLAAAFSSGKLANLRNVNLSNNSLRSNGMLDVAQGISEGFAEKNEEMSLALLHLRYNRINKQGAMAIANHILQPPVRGLVSLDLSHNPLSDRGVEAIGDAVSQAAGGSAASLQELLLEGVGMGRLGVIAMTACIRQAPSLVMLNLSDNKLTDAHGKDVAQALRSRGTSSLQPLDRLYLRHNKIHKSGALAIVTAMYSAPLLCLDLAENPIGTGGSSRGVLDDEVGRALISVLESQEDKYQDVSNSTGVSRCLTLVGLDEDVIQDSSRRQRLRQMLRRNDAQFRQQQRQVQGERQQDAISSASNISPRASSGGGADDKDEDPENTKSATELDNRDRGHLSNDPKQRLRPKQYLRDKDDVGRFVHELALRLIPSTKNDALPQCPRLALLVPTSHVGSERGSRQRDDSFTSRSSDRGGSSFVSKYRPNENRFFLIPVRRFFPNFFSSGAARGGPATNDEEHWEEQEMQLYLLCESSLTPLSEAPITLSSNAAIKRALVPIAFMTALVMEMLSPELGWDNTNAANFTPLQRRSKRYAECRLQRSVCEELTLAIQSDQDAATSSSSSPTSSSDTLLELMEKAYQTLVDIAIATENCGAWRRHLRVVIDVPLETDSITPTSSRRRPLWIHKSQVEMYRSKRRAQAASSSKSKFAEPTPEDSREALKLAAESTASAPCDLAPSYISQLTKAFADEFKIDSDISSGEKLAGPMEIFRAVDEELKQKNHPAEFRVKRVRNDPKVDILSDGGTKPIPDETAREMLHREMVVLIHYKHPNLPDLVGIGKTNENDSNNKTDGTAAATSSYALTHLVYTSKGGRQLSRVLANNSDTARPKLTWGKRVQIVFDVAKALLHLHTYQREYQCFHRNLQPSSIFVNSSSQEGEEGPRATLEGLEYSHFTSTKTSGDILPQVFEADRASSRLVGTAGTDYLCPAVQRGEEEYSRESDIYSLGIVMLELYTGRSLSDLVDPTNPIQEWTAQDMDRWAHGTVIQACTPSAVESRHEFCDLFLGCIAQDPKERPSTRTVVQRLQKILLAQEENTVPATP